MANDEIDQGGVADDDEDAPRKGMKTSTKVVLVAGGWVLLTLFLIGQFSASSSKGPDRRAARLDTVAGADLDGDGEIDPVVEEEAEDVNGDGIIELGEGVQEGTATVDTDGDGEPDAVAPGGSSGSGSGSGSGSAGVSGGQFGPGADDPTGPSAAPGAAPGGGSSATSSPSGSTATTSGSGGSTSGGSTSGGSTSGGSTATTAGSSSTSSSTSSPPTTSGGGGSSSPPTSSPPPPPPPPNSSAIILIVKAKDNAYVFPNGFSNDFSLPTGSQIRFDNIENDNSKERQHTFTVVGGWDSGDVRRDTTPPTSPAFSPGTYVYSCKYHPTTMRGTFTVG